VSNLHAENVIHNYENSTDTKCDKRGTLQTIQNESKNARKYSNDIYYDCEATKVLSDSLCLATGCDLTGFVQEITQIPFGIFLMSDIQVSQIFLFSVRFVPFIRQNFLNIFTPILSIKFKNRGIGIVFG
jgi:hypothetical protein